MNNILCATDLSAASETALFHALLVADRAGCKVELLHVLDKKAGPEEEGRALSELESRIAAARAEQVATPRLVRGEPLQGIAEAAQGHGLVVLGSHGPKGLRQNLFGADILKLVRKLPIPALVVQEHTPRNSSLDRIVMPVAAHEDIGRLIDMVCELARLFTAEVEVYQLMRPNESPSDELLSNKRDMLVRLEQEGLRYKEVNEPSTMFSVGFAEPTIRHAQSAGAACIAIMSHASQEYRYMADAEKERILTNEAGIAVLCA